MVLLISIFFLPCIKYKLTWEGEGENISIQERILGFLWYDLNNCGSLQVPYYTVNMVTITSLGIKKYYGDDGVAYDEWGVLVAPGGWRYGDRWDMDNQGIYKVEAGHRSVSGGLSTHIWAVHRVIYYDRN